ncbi:MAG: serine/threonine protein kinase [Bacilli bacterium]|nr:serine/threonine protein kinase [Bacilli bacterium]
MEIMNLSQKKFHSLERYELPKEIFNTEAKMYILPIKNRWNTVNKILKRLYVTNGPMFGNKLQTINSLIDLREKIDIPEIVFPEKIAAVNSEIVGYTMELVESINLETALKSYEVSPERKIKYLKQVGEILEKMRKVRKYKGIKDFYLNDIHEHNFIIEDSTDSVRVVDIDSCKINGNYTFGSRYLSPMSFISTTRKYQPEKNGICGGFFVPSYDTEIYCYIVMILNTLFGENITKMTIPEFYNYLEYLNDIGIDLELLQIFEKILDNDPNENPYELLDCLKNHFGRARGNVYAKTRRK